MCTWVERDGKAEVRAFGLAASQRIRQPIIGAFALRNEISQRKVEAKHWKLLFRGICCYSTVDDVLAGLIWRLSGAPWRTHPTKPPDAIG